MLEDAAAEATHILGACAQIGVLDLFEEPRKFGDRIAQRAWRPVAGADSLDGNDNQTKWVSRTVRCAWIRLLSGCQSNKNKRRKWVSTTIRRARIGSRMACQADERTGNLSELPRSKAEIQGWFAGIALARSRIDAAA